MATLSPGYSLILRVQAPSGLTVTSELATAAARVGTAVTAFDVVESHPDHVVVDVSCNVADADHRDAVRDALESLEGVHVRKISDRTFLIHLGGKVEVTSRVSLRNRDDLSRAYTPGVARVCMAIHENPEDARRLTIKRNTVAVVTDGAAIVALAALYNALRTDIAAMNEGAVVSAMANPDPEIDPSLAVDHATVVATGRSDFPNQINNVLAFPGLFRGLLDAGASKITTEMLVAAARAIAESVAAEELNASYIVPSVFDPHVAPAVAEAVRAVAEAVRAVAGHDSAVDDLSPAVEEHPRAAVVG